MGVDTRAGQRSRQDRCGRRGNVELYGGAVVGEASFNIVTGRASVESAKLGSFARIGKVLGTADQQTRSATGIGDPPISNPASLALDVCGIHNVVDVVAARDGERRVVDIFNFGVVVSAPTVFGDEDLPIAIKPDEQEDVATASRQVHIAHYFMIRKQSVFESGDRWIAAERCPIDRTVSSVD